jgi:hypothetical protein
VNGLKKVTYKETESCRIINSQVQFPSVDDALLSAHELLANEDLLFYYNIKATNKTINSTGFQTPSPIPQFVYKNLPKDLECTFQENFGMDSGTLLFVFILPILYAIISIIFCIICCKYRRIKSSYQSLHQTDPSERTQMNRVTNSNDMEMTSV